MLFVTSRLRKWVMLYVLFLPFFPPIFNNFALMFTLFLAEHFLNTLEVNVPGSSLSSAIQGMTISI